MPDSVRPHRRQPTRLPRPWDSPGKNTGVGCHFLLQCMKVKSESEVTVASNPQRPHGLQPSRLLCPWDFPGKSTGVGCHSLLNIVQYTRHPPTLPAKELSGPNVCCAKVEKPYFKPHNPLSLGMFCSTAKVLEQRLPWWSSDQDSAFPMQGSGLHPWSGN